MTKTHPTNQYSMTKPAVRRVF